MDETARLKAAIAWYVRHVKGQEGTDFLGDADVPEAAQAHADLIRQTLATVPEPEE